ncbi:NB-ARC domain-containing protein [Sphaerothrix gracilis]|uniref:NB-ARC domain-containing protein n=1 Tax=Sphaerothrix gracilis TaxID=3151835 RepID=UPI0031FDFE34
MSHRQLVVLTNRGLDRLEATIAAVQRSNEAKKFTQVELAQQAGTSTTTLRKIRRRTGSVWKSSLQRVFEGFKLVLNSSDCKLQNSLPESKCADKRDRGVTLTNHGLTRLEAAISSAQAAEKFGQRFTQIELKERTERKSGRSLCIKTIKKIRNRIKPADTTSIRNLFEAFNLELEAADYGLPDHSEFESQAVVSEPFERPKSLSFQVPPLPYYFVERPEHQNAIKQILLETPNQPGTLVMSAIYGLGGIGKSVLAMAIANDRDITNRFSDGVLWITLGQQPKILPLLGSWVRALGDHKYQPKDPLDTTTYLRRLLTDKKMLLVVDDVWHAEHAEAFRVGSSDCCVLITTREARIPQARRYSLDVMSPNQALDLITKKLMKASLSDDEKEQAYAFAKRVGYLPLALELAVSHIEEGMTWHTLFAAFDTEVARLEAFDLCSPTDFCDVSQETSLDHRRRKYSLIACFNLSLKRLLHCEPELLTHFAWLGVTPEDVSLTSTMAMTLWQTSQALAEQVLHRLSVKALIQRAAQPQTYRMHDLMHDLAQKLLIAPPNPQSVDELPGLGLTKVKAHRNVIARYRQKTELEQWHTLPDDGYIHTNLTWHLEQAEQFDQIHALLQETMPDGRNGWYQACVSLGQTAIFVADVARAWRLANGLFDKQPARAIALQCRYALIKASLNSLAFNFPPELIGALVETGRWSPAQGLTHIQQLTIPWHRWKSLEEVILHLPERLLEEALKISKGIQDKDYQSMAMIYLSTRMPRLKPFAREIAEAFSDPYFKTCAWGRLATQEPSLWNSALKSLQSIRREIQRAWAIKKIIFDIPNSYLEQVLVIAEDIKDVYASSIAIGAVIKTILNRRKQTQKALSRKYQESLKRAEGINDICHRAEALVALAPIFIDLWHEVLELVKDIKHEQAQVEILNDLILYVPKSLLSEVIGIARSFQSSFHKALILGVLTKREPELWQEALEATKIIKDQGLQIKAISRFSSEAEELQSKIVDLINRVKRPYDRAVALSAWASHNPSLWPQALAATRDIRDVYSRALAFKFLIIEIPDIWPEVLKTVQEIQGAIYQVWVLEELAPEIPKLWPITLNAIQRLWFESDQAISLYLLADKMPKFHALTAINVAESIQDESERVLALSAYIENDSVIFSNTEESFFCLLNGISKEYYFILILCGRALKQPEKWSEVIDALEKLQSDEQKSKAIQYVASKIPSTVFEDVFKLSLAIKADFYRAIAVFSLLPYANTLSFDYEEWCKVLSALSCHSREAILEIMPLLTSTILALGGQEALVETADAIESVGQQW